MGLQSRRPLVDLRGDLDNITIPIFVQRIAAPFQRGHWRHRKSLEDCGPLVDIFRRLWNLYLHIRPILFAENYNSWVG